MVNLEWLKVNSKIKHYLNYSFTNIFLYNILLGSVIHTFFNTSVKHSFKRYEFLKTIPSVYNKKEWNTRTKHFH